MEVLEYINKKIKEVTEKYNSITDSNEKCTDFFMGYYTALVELKEWLTKEN